VGKWAKSPQTVGITVLQGLTKVGKKWAKSGQSGQKCIQIYKIFFQLLPNIINYLQKSGHGHIYKNKSGQKERALVL
jgi:hypothetical protein